MVHDVRRATSAEVTREILRELDDPVNFLLNSLDPLRGAAETLLWIIGLYEETIRRPSDERDQHLRFVESLKEELGFAEVQRSMDTALQLIETGAQRTHRAAAELWRANVAERGLYRELDVRQAVDRAIAAVESTNTKDIRFERSYRSIPLIPAIDGEVQELLRHLLANAVDAVDDGGCIEIGISVKHAHVEIRVQDDGCGIAADDLPRIFEPFFTRKPRPHPRGLGLTVCRSVVAEHNGTIEARSQPGEGAEFVVRLPIVQSSEEIRLAVACHRRRREREQATATDSLPRVASGS